MSSNPAPRTIYLLWRSSVAVRQLVDHRGRSSGATLAQFVLLSLLQGREGLSSADVARRLNVSPQTANEAITTLYRAGYVSKEPLGKSRKVLQLALTPAGATYLASAEEMINEVEADIFAGLTEQECEDLRSVCSRIILKAKNLSAE